MGNSASKDLREPDLADYYDIGTSEFDLQRYQDDMDSYDQSMNEISEGTTTSESKRMRIESGPRTVHERKNWRECQWYRDYIIDNIDLYNDPNSRHGKLFRRRFAMDKVQVINL